MSVGIEECLVSTLCADGHAPWIADEVKIGRAVVPRPPSIELMAEKPRAV